jgi:ketosteroid isomerase-like protein
MSQENVELVRRAYEAYLRGDVAAMVDSLAPDFVLYRTAPDGATYHGPGAIMEVMNDWTAGFSEFDMKTGEFIDANESQVIVEVQQHAVGASSGVATEADFWFVHTIQGGRIVRLDAYREKVEAFDAVGLRE